MMLADASYWGVPFLQFVSYRRLPWDFLGSHTFHIQQRKRPKDQGENQSDPYLKAWPKLVNEVAEVAEGHQR